MEGSKFQMRDHMCCSFAASISVKAIAHTFIVFFVADGAMLRPTMCNVVRAQDN